MTTLQEVEMAVASLSEAEYREFRRWFLERDWERWDRQTGEASLAGRLDFSVKDALDARKGGHFRDL